MKRFTIFAVLLVLVGVSTGFALEFKPSVTLEGNEKLTLGMDLNTGAIGFNNETDATLKVFLVADESTDTHKGTGAIYGSITISDFDLFWVDGKENSNNDHSGSDAVNNEYAADVSATLYLPPFSIGLDAPGMSADVVSEIEANNGYDDFSNIVMDAVVDYEDTVDFAPAFAGNGTSVRYTDPAGMFWAQVDVKTGLKYAGVDPDFQTLALGGEFSLTISPVTFGLGAFYGFGYVNNVQVPTTWVGPPIVFYVSGKLTLEGIGVASIGIDTAYDTGDGAVNPFHSQFYASAQMNFNKEATAFFLLKALFDTHYIIETTQVSGTPPVLSTPADTSNHLDGYVDLEIPSGTLVGNLKVSLIGYILEALSADLEYATRLTVGYKVWSNGDMYITPQLTAAYGKPNALRTIATAINTVSNDAIMAVNPAVEIGLAAAPLSTLTLGWSSGNLLRTGEAGAALGALELALKITY